MRLINADALLEYLMINMGWHDEDGREVDDWDEKREIIKDLIDGVPTVDAVPMVRCRDCKYYCVKDFWADFRGVPILAASDVPTCNKWANTESKVDPDGFCFLAEKKVIE